MKKTYKTYLVGFLIAYFSISHMFILLNCCSIWTIDQDEMASMSCCVNNLPDNPDNSKKQDKNNLQVINESISIPVFNNLCECGNPQIKSNEQSNSIVLVNLRLNYESNHLNFPVQILSKDQDLINRISSFVSIVSSPPKIPIFKLVSSYLI